MWAIIHEHELTERHASDIEVFWQTQVTLGKFSGQHGANIHYALVQPENPKAHIVFSNGRIETLLKYKAFALECYQNNIALYMLDHRGQGLSDRMIKDPQRGYVEKFDDYVQDLATFVEQIVMPLSGPKPVLACHSMGSAIGYLTALQHPNLFSRVLFCSPMFGVKPAIPKALLAVLLKVGITTNRWFGRKPWYAIGQGPYIDIPFKLNILTHSDTRYRIFRAEYKKAPQLQLGGVTFHWLEQATKAMDKIEASAPEFPLNCKVLMSGADKVVDNKRIARVVNRMPTCSVLKIEGARHELLFERDDLRDQALTALFEYATTPEGEATPND
ncbi:alpha/beta fold hydrolase [Alteromonas facilis]|uniref:alpha/beta fold hydrolase n=1 Tax=Alteromonas facilis TaxID=2048004 RepID=UPI000C283E4E|nr:alpha/beta fold hydrolase [Alteromonas facilis]